jgi:hypothetical protein
MLYNYIFLNKTPQKNSILILYNTMSKMFFEVKKYIPEKHMFDAMEYFKEKKVSFNFNNFKSSKTLKLKIYIQEIKQGLISGAHQKNENIFLGCLS